MQKKLVFYLLYLVLIEAQIGSANGIYRSVNASDSKQHQGCVSDPADVVFLLDRSGSVGKAAFHKELDFIREFATHYVIGPNNVRIGIVTFSGWVKKEFNLNENANIQQLQTAINNIIYPPSNGTHTSIALKYARENSFTHASGDRANVPNFLVVITDGLSRPAQFNPKTEAHLLHKTNIETFSIGVGHQTSMDELKTISSGPNHVFTINTHLDLHLPLRHIRCEQFKTLATTVGTTTVRTTTAKVTTTVKPTTKESTTTPTTTTTTVKSTTTEPTTASTTATTVTTTTSTTASTTTKKPVECMGCKRIAEPHDCREVITCAEHEQCSTDFYITPEGSVFYDLGCRANRVCDAISNYGKREISKRQDENVYICQDCCNSLHCNRYGCSDKVRLNRTVCYSCVDVANPKDCDVVNICDQDKTCFARHYVNDMFEERWHLGCDEKQTCEAILRNSVYAGHPHNRRQIIGGFDALDICYYCCDHNFCNKQECIKGLLASTTQVPVTSTRHA